MPARILVVDDEPDLEPLILQKFRRRIRDGELEFFFARHGEDALESLRKDATIDVVMSDINMPVMDGLTLLSRLAEMDRHVKTVIVSAYDDMQNIRTAMNRGAFDFLTKPIDFQDFEATLKKTLEEVDALRQSAAHRQQLFALHNELSIASRIQQSILPREFPVGERFETFAQMSPARMVSGDFFDVFLIDSDHLAFAVGDVSGKGIPAAIYMAVSRTLLRATAAQKLSPVECLLYVNHVLVVQGEGDMFVTLFYGILNLATGELEYCVAGATPPWILTPGSPADAIKDVRGTMLGLFEVPEIGHATAKLSAGATVFAATDGIMDAENPEGIEFSETRMRNILDSASGRSPAEIVRLMFGSVTEFARGANQTDDITALAIRFLGP